MKVFIGIVAAIGGFFAVMLTVGTFIAGWEFPPIDSSQNGFRGTSILNVDVPEDVEAKKAANVIPPPPYDPDPTGERAGDIYENVQVLGHLSADQFNRIMLSITEWVVPADYRDNPDNAGGCAYCHNPANMAQEEGYEGAYRKNVTRKMFAMTWDVNENWVDHHKGTGVTCHTCHRGQGVPEYVWFKDPPTESAGFADVSPGQNMANAQVGLASLPNDPFSAFLLDDQEIRVIGTGALPPEEGPQIGTKQAEWTYGLMMHMSTGLGVNCTSCHNSRAFSQWDQSHPIRTSAWYGIRMVRDINNTHLVPLTSTFPDYRLGPTGDVAKVNCATCHQGVQKPLYGVSMLPDYPELRAGPAGAGRYSETEPDAAEPSLTEGGR